jgi:hypothetical protein
MERINCKADIEALYTLHGPTSVTVRCQMLCMAQAMHERMLCCHGEAVSLLTVKSSLAGHAD